MKFVILQTFLAALNVAIYTAYPSPSTAFCAMICILLAINSFFTNARQ